MTPDQIAAYLAHTLPEERRKQAESHLTMCDDCRGDLIAASATEEATRRKRLMTFALPAVAAAVVALIMFLPQDRPGRLDPQAPAFRGPSAEGIPTFLAVAPADGDEVPAAALSFLA